LQVLFLCPHGAAKSIIATAMLRDLAAREGLDVAASNAGTEPDEELNPIALTALRARGLNHREPPRLVTQKDIEAADVVVSFGCTPSELPTKPKRLIDWSTAPNVSDDVDALCRYIEARFAGLVGGVTPND
jgi:arsenate reductase (thioredoxin)